MTFLRRLGLFLCALLFCACLSALAFLAGLYTALNTPQPLKTALRDSGIYKEITPDTLSDQAAASTLPLTDPGVRSAFDQALPPTFYQQSSEQIIDGVYGWMHGGTEKPEFSIDIAKARSDFADNIAADIRQRLSELKPCDHVEKPPASGEEALSMNCMPPYVTPDSIADTARRQALKSNLIFKGDTVTAATLKDGQGRTLTEQLAFLPGLYQAYKIALVTLPMMILLVSLAVTYWSRTKRAGLHRLAWMLFCVGATGAVLAAVGVELFHIGARVLGLPFLAPIDIQDNILAAIETLTIGARPWWLGICAGYALLGLALFITLRIRRPKKGLRFSRRQEPQYEEAA